MAHLNPTELARVVLPVAAELTGGRNPRLETLPGGASVRRYHRVYVEGGRFPSLVAMELGDDPLKSEEASGEAAPKELPFLNILRYLQRAELPVPEVYRDDSKSGFLYLQDLGDTTFESRVATAADDVRYRYYEKAIDQLASLQRFAAARPDPRCVAFERGFDFKLLKWELDHFREYGLEARGHNLSAADREELERQFRAIAGELAAAPRTFVHRDYQSRNLMVVDRNGEPRLYVIDFQDALLGPRAYDLVGLLRDSYVALSPSLVNRLVDHFIEESEADARSFRHLFYLQVVQRKLKDAGRFVFIDQVKGNPAFLTHIPNSLTYVKEALGRLPALASVREILGRHIDAFR